MITEAIVLVGGLGTRLRSVVGDLPKCMAPVNGIPFINFIVSYLRNEGIQKFIFSLGYKHEIISAYLDKSFPEINKIYVIEELPLGTGGAIKKAVLEVKGKDVIIINGDTLFNIDLAQLSNAHRDFSGDCTIALKQMTMFSRYGTVELNSDLSVKAFNEKKYCEKGMINGGIYALDVTDFLQQPLGEIFSFENEFLQKNAGAKKFYGMESDHYFIDIGIPEDFNKFQQDYNFILSKKKYDNPVKDWDNIATIGDIFFELLD